MTVHRNRFLVNKTNKCTEFQLYWYYDSTCFGQHFCPSSGVLSRTSALVHFIQLWWPFATRSSKRSSQLHKMYQSRCTAKKSWWWAESLPETCSRNTNKIGIRCICWFYSQGIRENSSVRLVSSPSMFTQLFLLLIPLHTIYKHTLF